MKVGFLSCSYAPEVTGIGPYSADLAQALADRGHEVRVLTTFPFYPAWVPQIPKGTFILRSETMGRVSVTRCRVYVPRSPGAIRRLCHEFSWLLAAAVLVVRNLRWADVWLVVSPAFGSAVVGSCAVRFFRSRVHLHVQDVVPDVALESGQIRASSLRLGAALLARWTYRAYASCSVLSDAKARAVRVYLPTTWRGEILTAPNWPREMARPASGMLPHHLRGKACVL